MERKIITFEAHGRTYRLIPDELWESSFTGEVEEMFLLENEEGDALGSVVRSDYNEPWMAVDNYYGTGYGNSPVEAALRLLRA